LAAKNKIPISAKKSDKDIKDSNKNNLKKDDEEIKEVPDLITKRNYCIVDESNKEISVNKSMNSRKEVKKKNVNNKCCLFF
jgi:hypothetical protein